MKHLGSYGQPHERDASKVADAEMSEEEAANESKRDGSNNSRGEKEVEEAPEITDRVVHMTLS